MGWGGAVIRGGLAVMLLAGCSDGAVEGSPDSAPATSAAGPPPTTEAGIPPLPRVTDPCATGPRFELDTDVLRTVEVDGVPRTLAVRIPTSAVERDDPPPLTLSLHGATGSWEQQRGIDRLDPDAADDGFVVVRPEADPGPGSGWSAREGFNVHFVETVVEALSHAVCFDPDRLRLWGGGQGGLVIHQVVCDSDLPVELAFSLFGLVSPRDCDPPRPVPLVSINNFEPDPFIGSSFDVAWTPPVDLEARLVGPVGPVPEDLAEWADRYHCTDGPVEETVPDPRDGVDRDAVILSYEGCDAELVAIGFSIANLEEEIPELTARVEQLLDSLLG